jgi:hypothetical protein
MIKINEKFLFSTLKRRRRFFSSTYLLWGLLVSPQVFADPKRLVFDLTGSFHGSGDIMGPIWTLLDLKKRINERNDFPAHFVVLLDKRAELTMKALYKKHTLVELEKFLGITIIRPSQVATQPPADYLFQLFYGGRRIESFDYHPLVDPRKTWTIVSNTMHGNHFDEVRRGQEWFHFKPPGLGQDRSGIVTPPSAEVLGKKNPLQKKQILWQDLLLTPALRPLQILFNQKANVYPHVKFGFIYGIHNEILHREYFPHLQGQTKSYLQTLARINQKESPIVVFTPNSQEEVQQAILNDRQFQTLTIDDLNRRRPLKNKVYICSINKIAQDLFQKFMAVSDFPVLLEGNVSISAALRLKIPFVMFRSIWNGPQIDSLIALEKMANQTHFYEKAYGTDAWPATGIEGLLFDLQALGEKIDVRSEISTQGHLLVQAMAHATGELSEKMATIIDFTMKLEQVGLSPKGNPINAFSALDEILKHVTDEILFYSIVRSARKSSLISKPQFHLCLQGLVDFLGELFSAEIGDLFSPLQPEFFGRFAALEEVTGESVPPQVFQKAHPKKKRAVIMKKKSHSDSYYSPEKRP